MAPYLMKIGYLAVGPTIDGRNVTVYVHAMVAECFLGPRPDGMEVNHINGDKADPRALNLEYVTHASNAQHARRIGLLATGDRHPGTKASDAQVEEMRARHAMGEGTCALARAFRLAPSTVSQIVNFKRRVA